MELYWGSGSAPCWKALIALHEKGFADSETGKEKFKSNFISFSNKEQKSKPVMDVNVRGEVPAFKDGNIIVNESNAIVLYLEANNESIREQLQELREDGFTVEARYKKQGTQLLPDDATLLAEVLQRFIEIDNRWMSKFFFPLLRRLFYADKNDFQKVLESDEIVKALQDAKEELELYEGYLTKSSGKYLVGDEFTMADIALIVYLSCMERFGCKFTKYRKLQSYLKEVGERKTVKRTRPPHWEESEAPFTVLSKLDE